MQSISFYDSICVLLCFSSEQHVLQYNSLQNGAANDYPLCAANMNSFMYAVKDTFTCMTQSKAFYYLFSLPCSSVIHTI